MFIQLLQSHVFPIRYSSSEFWFEICCLCTKSVCWLLVFSIVRQIAVVIEAPSNL